MAAKRILGAPVVETQTDAAKRDDPRREPSDPPKPCALVPVTEHEVTRESQRFKPPGRRAAIVAALTVAAPILGALVKAAGDSFVAWVGAKSAAAEARAASAEARADELAKQLRKLERKVDYLEGVQAGALKAQGYVVEQPPGAAPPQPVELEQPPRPYRSAPKPKPIVRIPPKP